MVDTLKKSISRIKEQLKQEECQEIKLGIYIALNSLRNDFLLEDEKALTKIGLEEELEKYL